MEQLRVIFTVTIVIISFSTAGVITVVGIEAPSAEAGPRAIDSCTTISEPGRYVITQDLTHPGPFELGEVPCLRVNTSDVVIDGQGHRIFQEGNTDETGVSVSADDRRLSNVTVRDMHVRNLRVLGNAIRYENVDGGAIVNVTVPEAATVLVNSSDISVRESTFRGGGGFYGSTDPTGSGLIVRNTTDAVIAANTFSRFANTISSTAIGITAGSTNTTIMNNRLRGCGGCNLGGGPTELKEIIDDPPNPDRLPDYRGISIGEAIGTTVVNNTIEHYVSGIYVDHGDFTGDANETTRIANNTVRRNIVGLRVDVAQRPVAIRHNEITENGNGIYTPCKPGVAGAEKLQIHRNDIANNSRYGILNERRATLNATHNYWGAASGPASVNDSDAPFADPMTGTLADGEGDAISEDPGDPGVTNVRFDSWLNEPVTNSSADGAG